MYSEPQINRRLPPEAEMDRTDALDAFRAVLNTVTPEHPYYVDPFDAYPASGDEIEFGKTRTVYARCGPREPPMVAYYATRMTHINTLTREEHLALLTHEVTHIVVANRVNGHRSGHPPAFWREMAFHALELRDAIRDDVLRPVFGHVKLNLYLRGVWTDPKPATVDRRYWTVGACRARMRELLNAS